MDMESREFMNLQKSRAERVRDARMAFGHSGYAAVRSCSRMSWTGQNEDGQEDTKQSILAHRFRLLRFVTAAMLFLVLSVAFYFDFSYYGFDRQLVENCLQDNTFWTEMTEQIAQCIARIRP